jgi:hypothetical protein
MTRRGQISIESVFLGAFVIMLLGTIFSLYRFHSLGSTTSPGHDLPSTYQGVLNSLRNDARWAGQVEIQENAMVFSGPDATTVTYSIVDGSLLRREANNRATTLLTGLRAGGFDAAAAPVRLCSIWLLPLDDLDMPFFTSFALRGPRP